MLRSVDMGWLFHKGLNPNVCIFCSTHSHIFVQFIQYNFQYVGGLRDWCPESLYGWRITFIFILYSAFVLKISSWDVLQDHKFCATSIFPFWKETEVSFELSRMQDYAYFKNLQDHKGGWNYHGGESIGSMGEFLWEGNPYWRLINSW